MIGVGFKISLASSRGHSEILSGKAGEWVRCSVLVIRPTHIEVHPLRPIPSRPDEEERDVPFLGGAAADHAARGQDAARRIGHRHRSSRPAPPPAFSQSTFTGIERSKRWCKTLTCRP